MKLALTFTLSVIALHSPSLRTLSYRISKHEISPYVHSLSHCSPFSLPTHASCCHSLSAAFYLSTHHRSLPFLYTPPLSTVSLHTTALSLHSLPLLSTHHRSLPFL